MNYYNNLLNKSIGSFLKEAAPIIGKNPAMAKFALKTIRLQKNAAQKRNAYREQGIQVPPYMIISITNRCNLHCKGCYAKAQHRPIEKELGDEKLRGIIGEAKELGVSFVFLAGGEPLMRQGIFEITEKFPEVIFPIEQHQSLAFRSTGRD